MKKTTCLYAFVSAFYFLNVYADPQIVYCPPTITCAEGVRNPSKECIIDRPPGMEFAQINLKPTNHPQAGTPAQYRSGIWYFTFASAFPSYPPYQNVVVKTKCYYSWRFPLPNEETNDGFKVMSPINSAYDNLIKINPWMKEKWDASLTTLPNGWSKFIDEMTGRECPSNNLMDPAKGVLNCPWELHYAE